MSENKIPHVKFYVVMETFPDQKPGEKLAIRQQVCVFDNHAKNFCKHPEKIDVSEIWNSLKKQPYISGLILGQYQKEATGESIKKAEKIKGLKNEQ